jgi:hypothetical protein
MAARVLSESGVMSSSSATPTAQRTTALRRLEAWRRAASILGAIQSLTGCGTHYDGAVDASGHSGTSVSPMDSSYGDAAVLQEAGPFDAGGLGPATRWHYTSGGGIDANGQFAAGAYGFNLADVSTVGEINSLPQGVMALVWLGSCNGADTAFVSTVQPFVGNPKVFGFYLADEPDPTGQYHPLCPSTNLKAESDWIHANVPGTRTFIVLMNFGSTRSPSYANSYNPTSTGIDLYGLDPYPCRTDLGGCDYSLITAAVPAALAEGISLASLVPVYQAFGGGGWTDDTGGAYSVPTVSEEDQILATWAAVMPSPVFDYAYSWGVQNGDTALSTAGPGLQQTFATHNR